MTVPAPFLLLAERTRRVRNMATLMMQAPNVLNFGEMRAALGLNRKCPALAIAAVWILRRWQLGFVYRASGRHAW